MTEDPQNLMDRPCQRKAQGDLMLPKRTVVLLVMVGTLLVGGFWYGLVLLIKHVLERIFG